MALFPDVKIDFMKCISESQSLRLQMGPSLIPLEEGRPLKHSARARAARDRFSHRPEKSFEPKNLKSDEYMF